MGNNKKDNQKETNDFREIDENFISDVIDDAMENYSEYDKIGVELSLMGMFWPGDYRYSTMPEDYSGSKFKDYLSWLADYLYYLDATPSEEQKGLCAHVERMTPEGGVYFLGYNFGTFFSITDIIDLAIEEGMTLEEFLSTDNYINSLEDEKERENEIEFTKEIFNIAKYNYENKLTYCPDYDLLDLPARVPLSIVLKKEPDKGKRVRLLEIYYDIAGDMLSK
ncbi:hypothetical protein DSN97_07205 [Deferribacteraceae bacterium V6Fe1]|nr:hypothetical protein DSN97_07205 [Deferribacteraceae bacterium V6Fe1]